MKEMLKAVGVVGAREGGGGEMGKKEGAVS